MLTLTSGAQMAFDSDTYPQRIDRVSWSSMIDICFINDSFTFNELYES